MSKKHFELLAQKIREIRDPLARLQAAEAVSEVGRITNPRFDSDRFYRACGIEDQK
jgi:hypothetical protein